MKKLIPIILLAVMTACTPIGGGGCCCKSQSCECCKSGDCECCKDMKDGKQCPMCLKGKKAKQ